MTKSVNCKKCTLDVPGLCRVSERGGPGLPRTALFELPLPFLDIEIEVQEGKVFHVQVVGRLSFEAMSACDFFAADLGF